LNDSQPIEFHRSVVVQPEDNAADSATLRLDQFLKLRGIAGTGGQAKLMIQDGLVKVNGSIETRRRRKLAAGDVVEFYGQRWVVEGD